jgi:hypothetical protein
MIKITARVNEHAMTMVVEHQVGILLQGIELKNFNVEHWGRF